MKTKKNIKMWCIVFSTVILFLTAGCNHVDGAKVEGEGENQEEAYCRINGKNLYYVSDDEKQKWIEPLVKLLSNERREIYDRSASDDRYILPDPDSTYIEQCYSCGLLDVTGDGVPELLIHPWNYFGSSGTETYFIYDIYTGQKIGSIDGGNGGTWCAYYNTTTEELRLVNQYWLRGGWAYRSRYLSMITCSDEGEYRDQIYLHVSYLIDGEEQNIVDEDPDDGFHTATWVETYPETCFWILGEPAYLDEYYTKLDSFHREYIRISEAELTMIRWNNHNYDEDARFERAREMAEALVSSGQKFILPENNK